MTDTRTAIQAAYVPAIGDGTATLCELYRDMPRNTADGVPWTVTVLENPKSPFALPGAVDLFTHDCIHLLLGRGLLQQDEAFVLGFTMGTSPAHRSWQVALFAFCAQWVYRGAYRFSALDARVFEFGVRAGRSSRVRSLATVDFRAYWELPIATVRQALGVCPEHLAQLYHGERKRWPGTAASARLAMRTTMPLARTEPPDYFSDSVRGCAPTETHCHSCGLRSPFCSPPMPSST